MENKINISLMNVVEKGDYGYEQEVPLGILSVTAFIRENGYPNTKIHQCFAEKGMVELDEVSNIKSDLYGFQINMVNFESLKKFFKLIKEKHPNAKILCGGPFLTTQYISIMKAESLIDFIISGEGEYTFLELADTLSGIKNEYDYSKIESLIWRDDAGNIIKNNTRKQIKELDELPFVARDFIQDARRDPVDNAILESIRIVTSRGCVSDCTFCCVNLLSKEAGGKKWRGRSPQNVVDEVEYLVKEHQVKVLNFSDSSFEDPGKMGKIRSREICEEIIKRDIKVSSKIYMRCDSFVEDEDDIELLKLYKKSGIDVIIIGAESGSDLELEYYNKRASAQDNYKMTKLLVDMDMFYVFVGFIMFGPNTTLDILKENIAYLRTFNVDYNLGFISNTMMLIKDSKLYHMLKLEDRVIEAEVHSELPKYKFLDARTEKIADVWQNVFSQFPVTQKVSNLQINGGNLVSRMLNPMNQKTLDYMYDEFILYKEEYKQLNKEFGDLQSQFFLDIIDMVEKGCSSDKLQEMRVDFFGNTYTEYLPKYEKVYYGFIEKIQKNGFSLSGIIFENFMSALIISDVEKFENNDEN